MWETVAANPVQSVLASLLVLASVVAGVFLLSAKKKPERRRSPLRFLVSGLLETDAPSENGRAERWGAAASYFSLAAGFLTLFAATYIGVRQNEISERQNAMSERQNAITEGQSEAQTLTMFADALPVVEFVHYGGKGHEKQGIRNVGKGIAFDLCKHDARGGNVGSPVNAVFVSALENGSANQPLDDVTLWGSGGTDNTNNCDGRYGGGTYVVYMDAYQNSYKSTLDKKMGHFCRITKDTGEKAWNARGPFVPCEAGMSGTKNP